MKRGHTYRSRNIPGADFFVLQVNTRQVSGWWVSRSTGSVLGECDTIERSSIKADDWTEVSYSRASQGKSTDLTPKEIPFTLEK